MKASDFRDAVGEGTDVCFACGEKVRVGATWHGAGGEVWICRRCAEWESQALGALVADAVADQASGGPYCQRLEEALRRLESQAWRALAIALERKAAIRE